VTVLQLPLKSYNAKPVRKAHEAVGSPENAPLPA